ncbi:hypothetical protein ADUPG1_011887 [Aduncisulcus paluster]|uniref:Uncharacterized protein n=1 Tax=Aduncisulcus paluster TaxID=2918883 RepID=A0ABQ5JXN3_9EUKA|nr:hypothetical protein ADUPG1_011887 [Aduncisulcus paluster]
MSTFDIDPRLASCIVDADSLHQNAQLAIKSRQKKLQSKNNGGIIHKVGSSKLHEHFVKLAFSSLIFEASKSKGKKLSDKGISSSKRESSHPIHISSDNVSIRHDGGILLFHGDSIRFLKFKEINYVDFLHKKKEIEAAEREKKKQEAIFRKQKMEEEKRKQRFEQRKKQHDAQHKGKEASSSMGNYDCDADIVVDDIDFESYMKI